MDREKVSSSMFTSIGYDENTQTIELEFSNGKIYQHSNVSVKVFTEFKNAQSLGKFYNQFIKGKFPSRLIK
jgi:hypothetical protein